MQKLKVEYFFFSKAKMTNIKIFELQSQNKKEYELNVCLKMVKML